MAYNVPEDGDRRLWDTYKIPKNIVLYASTQLSQLDSSTETLYQINPVPSNKASMNKHVIMYALNHIQLLEQMQAYLKYQDTTLTINMSVEKEDYGLTVPEGDEIIIHLDLNKAKRQFEKIRTQLVQDIEEEDEKAPEAAKEAEHSDAYQALHDEGFGYVSEVKVKPTSKQLENQLKLINPRLQERQNNQNKLQPNHKLGCLRNLCKKTPSQQFKCWRQTIKY